ncbi:hypothetical protein EHQ53_01375 [Leptospira langatensis]|uniref:Uncharacterized protein n=1 Tax=Leptospira langatensis TaxID=2484983 RepID=A0A5F1ZWR8_9LEPT|nr:hypothetical protein [Leptospira langatensis]TGJ98400.1 hypothetical protein EHO57_17515 [Leptospira langatensis]TGL43315.1 hypothetical protein EHQ53_01375 [Leptospira langatensis]
MKKILRHAKFYIIWRSVFGNFLHKCVVALLLAIIILPTEQDGVADIDVLSSGLTQSIEAIDFDASHDNSIDARSFRQRFDFLDFHIQNFEELEEFKTSFYSVTFTWDEYFYSKRISVLLLNLPPPILA